MKIGDLVMKVRGHHDCNKIGVIMEIIANDVGNTILTVNSNGKIKNWYADFVEILNESR